MPEQSLIPFAVEACLCPGTPHSEGDSLSLYPKLPFRGGYVALRRMASVQPPTVDEVSAVLMETYIVHGIASWTMLDDEGAPLPLTPANIGGRILGNLLLAMRLGDAMDKLYSEELMSPLASAASSSSRHSRTNGSTYQRPPSSTKHPRPPKRSSTSTTDSAPPTE